MIRFLFVFLLLLAPGLLPSSEKNSPVRESPRGKVEDAVFLRRVYLTAAGRIPSVPEARAFLADTSPDKRSRLIDQLLESEEFADLLAMRLADLLRIKSEFPINLWPNAVQAWHRKIRSDLLADRSWKEMLEEMLTASGSNFRVPAANFFRASPDRTPEGLAAITAQTVLGCNLEKLPDEQKKRFAAFFSRIRYKSTDEWKEEIVYTDPAPAVLRAALPGGEVRTILSPDSDPRRILADELLKPDSGFAEAAVNRVWCWIFGRGIYPDPDDLPAERNNPRLKELTRVFRESGYRFRELYRRILNAEPFQSPVGTAEQEAEGRAYPIHRLEAELLIDALAAATGGYDRYMSVIPEPFTFLPARTRAVTIADGSMSSGVLDSFGRPPRDSGKFSERRNAITDSQRLYLMNSGTLHQRISRLPGRLFGKRKLNDRQRIDLFYLRILSRYSTRKEREAILAYRKSLPPKQRWNVWRDLAWVLINSKEFLYYH